MNDGGGQERRKIAVRAREGDRFLSNKSHLGRASLSLQVVIAHDWHELLHARRHSRNIRAGMRCEP